jgi:integrase
MGCGLRRAELTMLRVEDIQQREEHWVIADLIGKGGHIRTIPVPDWVKAGIDAWMAASGIKGGHSASLNQQSWPSMGYRLQPKGHMGRGEGESKDL